MLSLDYYKLQKLGEDDKKGSDISLYNGEGELVGISENATSRVSEGEGEYLEDIIKKINDVYGHIIGDKVLVESASLIRNLIGPEDIVGRYGGEEFIIILKNRNNNFKDTLERIRRGIEQLSIEINNDEYINITVSIGVAKFDVKNMTLEENIALADKSLYKAKNLGKNIVVYW